MFAPRARATSEGFARSGKLRPRRPGPAALRLELLLTDMVLFHGLFSQWNTIPSIEAVCVPEHSSLRPAITQRLVEPVIFQCSWAACIAFMAI